MRMKSFFVLGAVALMGAGFAACRSSSGGGGGSGGSGAVGGSGATAGTGGTGATAGAGGTAGTGATGGTGGTAGSGGGSGGTSCTGTAASVNDIDTGTVGLGQSVELTDVVATSQKFLVSASKNTGSCLWGVFVTDGGQTTVGESTSTMIVSYGDDAVTTDAGVGPCNSGTDAIPDDVKPGDKLHMFGTTDSYAPSTCTGGQVEEIQVRVDKSCPVTKNGTATVPAPHVIDTTLADTIAAGTDTATLHKWGGALVELDNATADTVDGGGIVGPYGVITFSNTNLEAHDKIMYYDVKDPKNPANAWVYGSATTFTKIVGIAYLDYCTWSLNPRDKCTDLDPKSDDCP